MQSAGTSSTSSATMSPTWMKDSVAKMELELVPKYGPLQQARVKKELQQVAEFCDRQHIGRELLAQGRHARL